MTKTQQTLRLLRDYESRNVTHIDPDGSWPIVWDGAKGVHVWDVEGKKYLDLTAAFGVTAAGHANPRVVRAGQKQMGKLLHAMGDVHPHPLKAQLARELSRITFERWSEAKPSLRKSRIKTGKTIFCSSGSEAVEAALKTAILATGKSEIIAFNQAYHGLGYGALNATHREHFRAQFHAQLGGFSRFVAFPDSETELFSLENSIKAICEKHRVGAILVEPIQARGGINLPPTGFLPLLRRLCDRYGALLILDEVYTGFGRTGKWFACEHSATVPDLICLGKALTGGFPLSACVGRADLMDRAWPVSQGEAIHTSTYLGHPVGCAMALAQIEEIRKAKLVEQSAVLGDFLLTELRRQLPEFIDDLDLKSRGLGLIAGVELSHRKKIASGFKKIPAMEISLLAIKKLLHAGFIFLPEGEHANVIGFTPPLTISKRELAKSVAALKAVLFSLK